MDYRNSSIQSKRSLTSQFRGPHIFNLALTPEEEKAAADAKAAEDAAAAEAAKAEEDRLAAEAAAKAAAEEDPITTPNPFDEGSPQHDAFEKQREKFKAKLVKETEAARKDAEGSIGSKLDELITVLKTTTPQPKDPVPPPVTPPPEEEVQVTEDDMKIVTGVMKKLGMDPHQIVQERRRNEVNAALAQIRKENPDVQFDDLELVKHANASGLAQSGLSIARILELSFLDKHRDALKAAKPVAPPAPTPPAPKKEGVPISKTGTNTQPTNTEKPKGLDGWKARIFGKYGAK